MIQKDFENLETGDEIIYIESIKEQVFDYWIVNKTKFNKTIQGASIICDAHSGSNWTEIPVGSCESYEKLEVAKEKYAEYYI